MNGDIIIEKYGRPNSYNIDSISAGFKSIHEKVAVLIFRL